MVAVAGDGPIPFADRPVRLSHTAPAPVSKVSAQGPDRGQKVKNTFYPIDLQNKNNLSFYYVLKARAAAAPQAQSSSRPTQTARPTMRTRSASWSVVQASMGG